MDAAPVGRGTVTGLEKGDLITHGGDNKGFHAFVGASVERKFGFVIMTNGDNGNQVIMNLVLGEAMQRLLVG